MKAWSAQRHALAERVCEAAVALKNGIVGPEDVASSDMQFARDRFFSAVEAWEKFERSR